MFESLSTLIPARESAVEAALRRLVEKCAAATAAQARTETRLAALGAAFDAGAAHLAVIRGAQAEIGRQQARQARALAAFAASRPASLDRSDQEIGAAAAATRATRPAALTPVSEWAVDEVAVGLGITGEAASRLLAESLQLVERLPGTLDALECGRLGWRHVQVMTDLVGRLDDELRPVAEERLLSRLADKTPPQLRAAARRVVQRLDAEAIARRVAEAVRDRRITVHPGDDGMATLSATLPAPVARAVQDALEQYADAAAVAGDERTRAQRMVDCLVDLVLRPGEHGLAPVQAQLTVVATIRTLLGGDEPGEVDGDLVPAAMVRELAYALGLLPRFGATSTAAAPPTGTTGTPLTAETGLVATEPAEAEPVTTGPAEHGPAEAEPAVTSGPAEHGPAEAEPAVTTGPAETEPAQTGPAQTGPAELAALLGVRTVLGTALACRPEIALTDELTGQLLALTDAAGLRAGRALGCPPESPGYRPGAELDRFVRRRDRRCRFPGCRARARRGDLDHTVRWPTGPTSAANLAALCRHHHRLRHQAPGWHLRARSDGGLQWTTPSGQVLVTHPPRHGADDDLAPPGAARSAPPDDDAAPPF